MTAIEAEASGAGGLPDEQWEDILRSIETDHCTPIVGAGACAPSLPMAAELAEELAREWGYPLADSSNLARVTQYVAIRRYDLYPKEAVIASLRARAKPDFGLPDDPHGVLAGLPISLFLTTNYDDFLETALRAQMRDVHVDYCRWNGYDRIVGDRSVLSNGYHPTAPQPLVYHLHGYDGMEQSLVLTEQDYLDFLLQAASSRGARLLPNVVRTALASHTLVFLGYSMTDWTFRVLFRSLVEMIKASTQRPAVSIQVSPRDVVPGFEAEARAYVERQTSALNGIDVHIYWGTARQFAGELRRRWLDYAT